MTTDQTPPGGGDDDPRRDRASGVPPGGSPGGEPDLPKAPPPGDPFAANSYGGAQGAVDPLAGMPPLPSRLRRLVARVIDAIVVGVPVSLILWPLRGDAYWDESAGGSGSWTQQAILLLVYFIYEGLMLSARGQTLGKMAVRIRVAMLDDGAVPRGNAAWNRAAVYSLPQLVPCIGFLFWLFNVLFCTWDQPYRQCLHDKSARTVVVTTV
ncbi:RDD family protein [Streptomyces sp. RFCAC02]|uniref:RDD family protein n=1 Tax=Streptomyces sp. RFCAC02 TaxID=2499143 RepID=UPI00101F8567|nr:RDD family protein [Streptomyces sp. RFCAC02]